MIAFAINLPPDVQEQVTSFAQQYSVDSLVASGVAQVSSNGQQFTADGSLLVTPFGVGIMGISKSVASALGFDATTQVGNIQAGVATLAALLQAFTGNYPLALAAYITSTDTVRTANGIPPIAQVRDFVYNVSKIAANAGSPSVSSLLTIRNDSTVDPSSAAAITSGIIDPQTKGINYGSGNDPATSFNNLNELQSTIRPFLQVADDTLSNTAWYADTGLITGNQRIRASVQPVSFMVYFDRNDPTQLLRRQNDGTPIEIQLNTSLSSFEISSKHVFNRSPSRTGMHITLWGMEPDLISGQGTTGVFMNQFGLTDFMSVAGINDDIVKLLTSGFKHNFNASLNFNDELTSFQPGTTTSPIQSQAGNFTSSSTSGFDLISTAQQTPTGTAMTTSVSGDQKQANDIIGKMNLAKPQEAFRVAAQDAFIELLKLFQMNGTVWFHSQSYANGNNGKSITNLGTIGEMEQNSPSAWSSKTGASSFQQHSRNNDVMTRGYVSMRYRNNIYLGYFKSFSWTQDAESPFQWKFNFTFQVEKTYTALYFPQPAVQFPQALQNILSITPPPPVLGE